jgi:hypothetical protein
MEMQWGEESIFGVKTPGKEACCQGRILEKGALFQVLLHLRIGNTGYTPFQFPDESVFMGVSRL